MFCGKKQLKRSKIRDAVFCLICSFSSVFGSNMQAKSDTVVDFLQAIRGKMVLTKVSKCQDRCNYPSGCELISIVNLLRTYGLLSQEHVKQGQSLVDYFFDNYFIYQPWTEKDTRRSHPNYCYAGNPKIPSKYGCGYGAFEEWLRACLKIFLKSIGADEKYKIVVSSNVNTDDLIKNYINKGYPVFVWCTQPVNDTKESLINVFKPVELKKSGGKGNSWQIHHDDKIINVYESLGDIDAVNSMKESEGKDFTWTRGEHCALLVGYTKNAYILNDPFRGNIYVDKKSFNESRKVFGNRMVCMIPIKPN